MIVVRCGVGMVVSARRLAATSSVEGVLST
jgi:hypothetical protein